MKSNFDFNQSFNERRNFLSLENHWGSTIPKFLTYEKRAFLDLENHLGSKIPKSF